MTYRSSGGRQFVVDRHRRRRGRVAGRVRVDSADQGRTRLTTLEDDSDRGTHTGSGGTSISGVVHDSSGGVVSGAAVIVRAARAPSSA